MRISSKIKDRESFTPTENEIIRFIQTNSDQAVNMTLDELAETIYVSKSTIIRFCKKLEHVHRKRRKPGYIDASDGFGQCPYRCR